MKNARYLALCTASAFAIAAIPVQFDLASKSFDAPVAQAKGGNGNGGNAGNGNGGGKGGSASGGKSASAGKGGSASGGKSASAGKGGTQGNGNRGGKGRSPIGGKSYSAKGHGKNVGKATSAPGNKNLLSVLAKKSDRSLVAKSSLKFAKAKDRSFKTQFASLPETVEAPGAKPKNFHAKLGALNSLKRNYRAYLHSKSPRFAAVAAFVKASAEYELARDGVKASDQDLVAARQRFSDAVLAAEITPYDGATSIYQDATVGSLTTRLAALRTAQVDPNQETTLEAEITAVDNLLASKEAESVLAAEADLNTAQATAEKAAIGTDDETLRQALLDMANKDRVFEYGDDYVDAEMMEWAKDVLGVDDAFGKIDEVKRDIAAKE